MAKFYVSLAGVESRSALASELLFTRFVINLFDATVHTGDCISVDNSSPQTY
ncbi:MAG: hypothetical protein ACI854_001033 [Arenicella sp.]|jgi:hypothetical protein